MKQNQSRYLLLCVSAILSTYLAVPATLAASTKPTGSTFACLKINTYCTLCTYIHSRATQVPQPTTSFDLLHNVVFAVANSLNILSGYKILENIP